MAAGLSPVNPVGAHAAGIVNAHRGSSSGTRGRQQVDAFLPTLVLRRIARSPFEGSHRIGNVD